MVNERRSHSPTPTLASDDGDSDASSHVEASEEEEEEVWEEGGELPSSLPPSLSYVASKSPVPKQEVEHFQPLFPVVKPGQNFDVRSQSLCRLTLQMGGDAMDYDPDAIFAGLVFYLDTPENAELNGLESSSPPATTIDRYATASVR